MNEEENYASQSIPASQYKGQGFQPVAEKSAIAHAKKHREEYEKGNCSAVRQLFNRKRICQQSGHRKVCSGTDDGYKNGNSVCSQDFLALADDIGVSIEAEFLREERISVADQCVFIGQ